MVLSLPSCFKKTVQRRENQSETARDVPPRYTNAVDMWSVGCILAELLGRRPLFPGKNFVHQLQLIFDVIGAPDDREVKKVRNKQARKFLDTVRGKAKVPFASVFPKAAAPAHDVLEKLLSYSFAERIFLS